MNITSESRKKNILLVEDEQIIAILEKKQLENAGYNVVNASTGEKAVELIREKKDPFDLILMDIDLGRGLDGTDAAREILEFREMPIVFLSSHTEKEVVERTEKISSYGYVVKNSGITVLDASIKMAFKLFDAKRESEAQRKQFKTILDSIGDAVISTDIYGNVIQMNPVTEELTGHSFTDAKGKHLNNFFITEDPVTGEKRRNSIGEIITPHMKSEDPEHMVLISRENKRHHIRIKVSPIIDTSVTTGIVLVFRDITGEHKNQLKMKKNEHSLKVAQRIAKLGSWEYSITGNEMNCTEEIYRIFELDKDIPSGRLKDELLSCINPEDIHQIKKTFSSRDNLKSLQKIEYTVTLNDGKKKHILCLSEPVFSSSGNHEGFRGTIQDITERKVIEERLQKNESSLEQAQALAHIGNWELDPETGGGFWSKEMYRLFEFDHSSGVPHYELFIQKVHPGDRDRLIEMHQNVLSTGKPENAEYRYISGNGKEKIFQTSIHAVRDKYGKIRHLAGIVMDISGKTGS